MAGHDHDPEFTLKPLHKAAVRTALQKVAQYRLLNEPWQAESICLDVLAIEPKNQEAIVQLLLSLTDQFDAGGFGQAERRARKLVPLLDSEYKRAYYAGIICERRARAQQAMGVIGHVVYDSYRQAMEHFEHGEKLQPTAPDDCIMRWNTCARAIMADPTLHPGDDEDDHPGDAPFGEF